MKWVLINDESELNNIKTYAYQIDRIGCMVLVMTSIGSSLTVATGTQIINNQLVPMEGYGFVPPEDIDYEMDEMDEMDTD